jgi:hypothetical protein
MKTPDEIKQGQKLCLLGTACGRCPYYNVGHGVAACMGRLTQDTLDYIQQLETEDAQKAQRIAGLEQELAAVKQERDAAVDSLRGDCSECKCADVVGNEEPCSSCKIEYRKGVKHCCKSNWQWRGVCKENAEVQDK